MKVCAGDDEQQQHGVTCSVTWQSGDSDSVASVTEAAVSNTLYKHWVEAAATHRQHPLSVCSLHGPSRRLQRDHSASLHKFVFSQHNPFLTEDFVLLEETMIKRKDASRAECKMCDT